MLLASRLLALLVLGELQCTPSGMVLTQVSLSGVRLYSPCRLQYRITLCAMACHGSRVYEPLVPVPPVRGAVRISKVGVGMYCRVGAPDMAIPVTLMRVSSMKSRCNLVITRLPRWQFGVFLIPSLFRELHSDGYRCIQRFGPFPSENSNLGWCCLSPPRVGLSGSGCRSAGISRFGVDIRHVTLEPFGSSVHATASSQCENLT